MSNSNGGTASEVLAVRFPVDASVELSLDDGSVAAGTIYCTDQQSQTVVLYNPLTHTTLASEVRVIHADAIRSSKAVPRAAAAPKLVLPKVQKKELEDREQRALRKAEESLRQVNQKASAQGQLIFDRLLKACNDVKWVKESIVVLNEVQVDAPYGPENCRALRTTNAGTLAGASLERVKKIVGASP